MPTDQSEISIPIFIDDEFKSKVLRPSQTKSSQSQKQNARSITIKSLLLSNQQYKENFSQIPFFGGNSDIQRVSGQIHLFSPSSTSLSSFTSSMICLMGVPNVFENSEILSYLMLYVNNIEFVRIFSSESHSSYTALVKFHDKITAKVFYDSCNQTRFNNIEDHICQLSYVGMVTSSSHNLTAIYDVIEIPNCVVCLEQLDKSPVVTVLCNHSYHIRCIALWESNNCPVCRHEMTPAANYRIGCEVCELREQNWLCLVCGFVGCGRYANGHAYEHFVDNGHGFFKDVTCQDVWDYTQDRYVHRVVQSESDSKLVAMESAQLVTGDEKVESVQLEYIHHLAKQQRCYQQRFDQMTEQLDSVRAELSRVGEKSAAQEKQVKKLEGKCKKVEKDLKSANDEVRELRGYNELLLSNRAQVDEENIKLKKLLEETRESHKNTVAELQSQVDDLLGHFTLSEQIPLDPDVRDGFIGQMKKTRRGRR